MPRVHINIPTEKELKAIDVTARQRGFSNRTAYMLYVVRNDMYKDRPDAKYCMPPQN